MGDRKVGGRKEDKMTIQRERKHVKKERRNSLEKKQLQKAKI